ncbi:MAG: cbb3-type cytochrome c oxidase subunit 3 [Lysobacter sp.]
MLSGIVTVALMLLFIGIWIWAWRPENKSSFDETARLALDDDPGDLTGTAEGTRNPEA